MSAPGQVVRDPTLQKTATGAMLGATDWAVAAIVFLAANQLAPWGLAWGKTGGLLLLWALVLVVGGCWRHRGTWVGAAELAAVLAIWTGWNRVGSGPALSFPQLAYGGGLILLAVSGWRAWRRQGAAMRTEPVAESIRVLGVLAGALYVMLPMFTDRMLGGTDSRWYAYMLHDFIEQWRTGGPPVFIGQGEYVWNGAVHPFRSAPVYMHVAGLWDWLTGASLGVSALQHLTAITAAVAAAWGMYAAGVKLAPQRRWEAAAIAVLYVTTPAALLPLYLSDAYMTYVACAAFGWVFYGNARLLVEGKGWLCLAGGLSLAWMSHPPTAMQVTLLSAFLQTGGLAFGRGAWPDWKGAMLGALAFGVLSAGYFVGMSELPKLAAAGMEAGLLQVTALLLGWFVGGRVIVMGRAWGWTLLLLPVAWILWLTCAVWLVWLGLTLGLSAAVAFVARRRGLFDPAAYAPLVLLFGVLLAAWLMDRALRAGVVTPPWVYPSESQVWSRTWSANYLKPLTPLLQSMGDFQPGWGLWLAGVAAAFAACRPRAMAVQLVLGAVVLMSLLLLHWPGVGDFMLEYIPLSLRGMTGMAMELRVMPVFAALLAVAGLLALRAGQGERGQARRRLVAAAALLAVAWSVGQARFAVQRGYRVTAAPQVVAKDWLSENAPMDRFVYDLLPIPSYFSHGKMDPRLEVRLLDNQGNLIYGPPQVTQAMEEAGVRTIRLMAHDIPNHKQWLQLEPGFELQPGEQILLRFEFDPARHYNGIMLLLSEHGYREYRLPEAGMSRAFGSGPRHSRVLSLWNHGREVEHYQIQFLREEGSDLVDGMSFATVTLSHFRPERALIRVDSLSPWRVRTRARMEWSGQLETPRVFLPGYEVKVDGRRIGPARISQSPDRLLQIAMPPGAHTVEVNYVGTWKLRLAWVVSLVAWLALFAGLMAGPRLRARWDRIF